MEKYFLFFMIYFSSTASFAYCFKEAGKAMKIDPLLLLAISLRESRLNADAVGINKTVNNKIHSYDYGLMQINSENVKRIFSAFGIDSKTLLNNPCINIYAGAYILRKNFNLWGENWWSIGAYNAGSKQSVKQELKRQQYAKEVKSIYSNLIRMNSEGKIIL